MTTRIPPLSEAIRNQVLAALDERAARLGNEVKKYEKLVLRAALLELDATENQQRALVWNIAALHETLAARELIGEAGPAPRDPIDEAKAYADWTEAEKAYSR